MGANTRPGKALVFAAAVCAGLAGCATPKLMAVPCNGGRCEVDVHVTVSGSTCTVSAPDIDNNGANNIFWNIDDESKRLGYKFPDGTGGVFFKNPPPSGCVAAGSVFDSPDRQNDHKFKWHNKGTLGTYCYGVTVVEELGPDAVHARSANRQPVTRSDARASVSAFS